MSPIPVPTDTPDVWITEAEWEGRSFWLGVLVRENGSMQFFEADSRADLWPLVASAGWPRRNNYGKGVPDGAVIDQIIAQYAGIRFTDAPDHYRVLPLEAR